MPRNVQFLNLQQDLRAELNQSTDTSVGVSYQDTLKRALRRSYQVLHRQWRWPHLHKNFDPLQLSAGQRYYDLPDGLDYDRLDSVYVTYDDLPRPIMRGVTFREYAAYPPDTRSDPVLRWDVAATEGGEQIEAWPIPDSGDGQILFAGCTRAKDLVNDADLVDLDSDLVVMFAAASLLPKDKGEAGAKLREAQAHLAQLKADSASPSDTFILNMGAAPARSSHPVILVR